MTIKSPESILFFLDNHLNLYRYVKTIIINRESPKLHSFITKHGIHTDMERETPNELSHT